MPKARELSRLENEGGAGREQARADPAHAQGRVKASLNGSLLNGWAVQVSTGFGGGAGESRQIFYAAFPEKHAAEAAVRDGLPATSEARVEAMNPVSGSTLWAMKMRPGQIKQWI